MSYIACAPCEEIQDCVGPMLSTVGFTYNDTLNRWDSGGTNGQVLTTNGSGGASWTTLTPGSSFITAVSDTSCIDLTVTAGTLSAVPIIDPAAGNLLVCGANGLAVSTESVQDAIGAAITAGCGLVYNDAANSMGVDVAAITGAVANSSLQALAGGGACDIQVAVSATAGNTITRNADGLFVPANFITSITDTNCIDLTVTAGALSAAPIISGTAGNSVTCTATGLFVPNLCTQLGATAAGSQAAGDTYLAINGSTCKRVTPSFTVLSNGAGSVGQTITIGTDTLNINGAGIATVVSSATDTVTVTVLCEDVQDCVGGMLNTVGFVYNDASNRWDAGGTNGQVLTSNGAGAATWTTIAGGGGSFTLAATSGTAQTISSGDTMTIAAGCGITTTASATDTVTVAVNRTQLVGTLASTSLTTGPGTCDLLVAISATAGNSVARNADGLYVPNLCTQLAATATGTPTATDTILSINGSTCRRVTLCDLLKTITQAAINDSTTDKMLVVDPTNNECKLAPTPLLYRSQCLGCNATVSTYADQAKHLVVCGDEYVTAVALTAGTAPVGSSLIVEIRNGATVLRTLTLAAGTTTVIDNTDFIIPNGAVVNLNVTQVGSTTPGANICVEYWYRIVGGTC